jgi:galactose-1-phosphate uridylyltransferase
MIDTTTVFVSIAQVAAGGTIVQALLAVTRRRNLRELDSNSTAGDAVDQVVGMLRTELRDAKAEITDLHKQAAAERVSHAVERDDAQHQRVWLEEQISRLSAELVIAKAENIRLQNRTGGGDAGAS